MPVRSESTESQRSGLNRRPRRSICSDESGATPSPEGEGASGDVTGRARPTPFALEVPNERPTAVSAVARLLRWLSGCLHAAATTSARDAVYDAPRVLDAAVWRLVA
jgi:hypothetical protein